MRGHGEKLSRKQEQLIAALLSGDTIEAAAHAVGIAPSTAYRWLQDAPFQQAFREGRREVVRLAVVRLQRVCGKAVDTLERVMGHQKASASAKVAAARVVLDMALKAVELEDLEERIAALEHRIEGGK